MENKSCSFTDLWLVLQNLQWVPQKYSIHDPVLVIQESSDLTEGQPVLNYAVVAYAYESLLSSFLIFL